MNINKEVKKIEIYCPVCNKKEKAILFKSIDFIPFIKKELKFKYVTCLNCKNKFPFEILSKKKSKLLSNKLKDILILNLIYLTIFAEKSIENEEKHIRYFYYMLTGEKLNKIKNIKEYVDYKSFLKSIKSDLTIKEKARILKISIYFLKFMQIEEDSFILNIGYYLDINPKLYSSIKHKI